MAAEALIVIDVQNDFCPGGALAVTDGDAVVPVVNRLIERFEHVVLTQDWHPAGHSSFASVHPGKEPFSTTITSEAHDTLAIQSAISAASSFAAMITEHGTRGPADAALTCASAYDRVRSRSPARSPRSWSARRNRV